jgi:xanthine dehydrogenase YagT iron-sulfur-binding subunit
MSQDRPPEDPGAERRGVSRRTFLRGTAIGALAPTLVGSGLALGCAAEAQETAATPAVDGVVGPGPVPVTLTVNGQAHELNLEPRVTLLDALRQEIGITGAKRVCDRGTCGACTVKVDGRIVYACSLLALEMQGAKIETVEALGSVERLHPLQAAFVEGDGQQCGFCTPGFIMACSAVLEKNAHPSHEEVARGLGGNFCRCGTYAGIRRAMEGTKGGARG